MDKINGVKFFQHELNYLKLWHSESQGGSSLTASSLSAYLLLHFYVDDLGRIREDDLVLKDLTTKHNLPYSSIHKGFHHLFTLELLTHQNENNIRYIQIARYAENNTPNREGKMNYFVLPKQMLSSGVLCEFIKARDVSGLLGFLDLINGLSREQTRKGKKAVIRKCESLLKIMKKTTRNIISWITRIGSLVQIKEQDGQTRRKKVWTFAFSEDCFDSVDYDLPKAQLGAGIRKEVQSALASLPIPLKSKDVRDAYIVMLQDGLDVFYPIIDVDRGYTTLKLLLSDTISKVIGSLAERPNLPIDSFGGFWRKLGRDVLKHQYSELNLDMRLAIKAAYIKDGKAMPTFLDAYNAPLA